MRIAFLGSGEFGLPSLAALHARHEVVQVVSQPDRPAGRRRHLTPTPIAAWAEQQALPIVKPDNVNDASIVARLNQAAPDLIVVIAFGQYIRPVVADLASLGSVNLHASLLPKYRGAAPINWAVIRGEQRTGNTVIRLAKRMDAGDMLGANETPIDPQQTAGELHDRLGELGAPLLLDVIERLASDCAEPVPQDESQATLAPKLSRSDAWIDFSADADEIRCRIHGLTPWPGVWVQCEDPSGGPARRLALRRMHVETGVDALRPGSLSPEGLVGTGQGALRIIELQPAGKRPMRWADYIHGHPIPAGAQLTCEQPLPEPGSQDR
jgi:methionyl-tRNA formyltransferase